MNPILMTLGTWLNESFSGFDLWAFHFLGSMQNDFLTIVAKLFTTFGDEVFVIGTLVLGIILCFFKKTRKFGFAIIFAVVIGTLITNIVLKPLALRVRPYNTLQDNLDYWKWYVGAGQLSESDYSFPSGHTTGAFEIATALFLCFRNKKSKVAYIFPVLALGTLGSRVYLMVHYATDVLGGLIAGIFAGCMGYLISCLIVKIFEKTPLDKIDVSKLFSKVKNFEKIGVAGAVVYTVAIFVTSFVLLLNSGGADAQRCDYMSEELPYGCQNEIDDENQIGENNYCDIHFEELKNQ